MEIGEVLQNRYRIEAELGQGGMGMVYPGRDLLLDRCAAIKALAQRGGGAEGRARMDQQAERLLIEDAAAMPVNYMRQRLLFEPWVQNFHPGMAHFFCFKEVILEA